MTELIEILDAVEDLTETGNRLVDAVKGLRSANSTPPVVNVASPAPVIHVAAAAAPVVRVAAPSVNVAPAPVSWEFTVTERDRDGFIVSFTANPTV
ncbi:MAG: hypothetical protein E4H01_14940 [Lysobacterales bacterium]|nr:MAG: hypothetical protein E4H01_14940 [Xanthomonadales bacterium]